jgi:hypothetical protein
MCDTRYTLPARDIVDVGYLVVGVFENKITASNINVGDFYTTEAHFLPNLLFVLSSDVAMLLRLQPFYLYNRIKRFIP